MGWINLLWKFLRLGPLPIGALAAVIMGAGYYLQVLDNERVAREAQALQAGMPKLVQLADARDAEERSIIGEVNVQAQLAWEYSYDLWYEENIGTDYVVMFPLIAADATSINKVLGVAILQAEDDSFETMSAEVAQAGYVGEGDYGPVMNLNGELDGMGKWEGLIEESFYDLGLTMPNDPIVIWPYIEGRDVALAPPEPGDLTIFGVFSKVAGVLGLLALGKLIFGGSGGTPAVPAGGARANKDFDPMASSAPQGFEVEKAVESGTNSGVPLWKQRSGLVGESTHAAETAPREPAAFATPQPAPMLTPEPSFAQPQPRRFGVRKILIGIVGGLFVLGLLSTVVGMIDTPTSEPTTVNVTSFQDLAAATAADIVVPDADSNRHWTDIDVTLIVEWFEAKSLLAASGDVNAMMILGVIGFLATILPIGANMYFQSHRRRLRSTISNGMDVFS